MWHASPMAIVISPKIFAKLAEKHSVSKKDVQQCFENRTGYLLTDSREKNKSDPPTQWFIAFTNDGRLLKICFVPRDGNQYLRSAYPPNEVELRIYQAKGKPSDF